MGIPLWLLVSTGIYCFANFIWSLKLYKRYKVFIAEKQIFDEKTSQTKNLHDLYPEFKRYDNVSFLRIFLGLIFFFWFKMITSVIIASNLSLTLKVVDYFGSKDKIGPIKRFFVYYLCKIHTFTLLMTFGMFYKVTPYNDEKNIYKKYLGDNYDLKKDKKYSSIVSNHVSWSDIPLHLCYRIPAFISKKEVMDLPIIGIVAKLIGCVFLDRASEKDRKLAFEAIKKKQEDYMNGETGTPLLIFPEGTTTSGRHLIKFKRGAFDSLLPIKPYIIKAKNKIFDTSTGCTDLGVHFVIFLCFLYHSYEIIDLPVIEPNEYLINNQDNNENKDSVEKFIEATRSIMSEIGGFEKSEKGVRDIFEYARLIDDKPLRQSPKEE